MSDDWQKLQQQYWEQWSEMSRRALGMASPQNPPWESALDHWWQAMAPAAPAFSREFMERLMDQGKRFFRLAESFARQPPQASDWAGLDWNQASQTLDEMQRSFAQGFGSETPLTKMMAFWELPYDNWQRMASSLSPVPGDLLRNMPHDPLKDSLNRILSAPGLGYTREEQSQYQDLMRRGLEYQKALQGYFSFFSHLGLKSTERLRDALTARQRSGKPIDSARVLYDHWVECCEQVYAEEVRSPEYARLHGELVNAQMALKQRMAIIVDETLGTLNMPTRSELRTLQDRMQEARRENKALRRELESLRKQVTAAMPETPAPPAAPHPIARRKTPVRKKTPVRPASE